MKKAFFVFICIFISSMAFADELYKVKVEFVHENEKTITYQYAILTDKGQFIEITINEKGIYERTTVYQYTRNGNRYTMPTSIGIDMVLEREGNDLVLRKTGKRYVRITDVNLLGM